MSRRGAGAQRSRGEWVRWGSGIILAFALGGFGGAPLAAGAQQRTTVPRIGVLTFGRGPRGEAFRQGLRELGYVEGQNIIVEYRTADANEDRLPALAAELVRLRVDLIAALDPPSARAATKATTTIPIVMRVSGDPVQEGLVASLARPGGNVTGVYSIAEELVGKRLELLKEVVPRVSRVAVLWDPETPGSARWFQEAEKAAWSLRVKLQSLEVPGPTPDYEGAFGAATRGRAGAIITLRNALIVANRARIASLAAKSRLPGIYDDREFVEGGGLMSYGTNLVEMYRRAATYVDKILKGTKPADLPVEQPTRFELVINLKAAKALGLTIPQSVLARADQVIQ